MVNIPRWTRFLQTAAASTVCITALSSASLAEADRTVTHGREIKLRSVQDGGCDGVAAGRSSPLPSARSHRLLTQPGVEVSHLSPRKASGADLSGVLENVHIEGDRIIARVRFPVPVWCDQDPATLAEYYGPVEGSVHIAVRSVLPEAKPKKPARLYRVDRAEARAQARAVVRRDYETNPRALDYGYGRCKPKNDARSRWKCTVKILRTDSVGNKYDCRAEVAVVGRWRRSVSVSRSPYVCDPV